MKVAEFEATRAERFPHRSARTAASAASMLKPFIEEFGDRDLEDIDKAEMQAWAARHPNRARYVRSLFGDAMRVDVCSRNPASGLRLPQSKGRAHARVMDDGELRRLADFEGRKLKGAIVFSAYTGIRLGELLALTPDCIDGDVLDIRCQLDKDGNEAPCKAASERRVIIPPAARRALPRARSGRLWPLSRSAHYRAWDSARRSAGLDFDWHELRHRAATWLFERGASMEEVAWQLGHAWEGAGGVTALYIHAQERVMLERLRSIAHG